jgi:hypothetical protein
MPAAVRGRLLREEAAKILVDHPGAAARAFLIDVNENTTMGWDRFAKQLPATPGLARRLTRSSAWEGRVFALARWTLLAGPLLLWLLARSPPATSARASLSAAVGLALSAAFFVLTSGVTFWTGPRIVFPGVAAGVALLALVTETVMRDVTRPRGSSEPGALPASPS